MDKRKRESVAMRLHAELVSHMAAVARLTYLVSGSTPDPRRLVTQMEEDLRRESAKIGHESSVYPLSELRIRKEIAEQVVAGIRRDVEVGGPIS